MGAETFHRNNFHKNTFCIFNEADLTTIAELKLGYKSKSGSSYYFTEAGVYRLSNHWGRAANCKWRLHSNEKTGNRTKLGFALWSAFHRDNETEKLYFIEVDFENQSVQFQHKDSGNYNNEVLRTASETTKRIRQIRNLLENDSWTEYYSNENGVDLKRKVIGQMIETEQTLQQIKADL
ncbi:hypothetical protein [Flavobacterium sp.]|uniref:hypothetical protein n=1 Tax=Flavobacterium sp. TaxID=239 RepID=UPI0039E45D26